MKKCAPYLYLCFFTCLFLSSAHITVAAEKTIALGFNLPLTGADEKNGQVAKKSIDLLMEQVNAEGGILINKQRYLVDPIFSDNTSSQNGATNAALHLITQKNVVAIIGPNTSSSAIPAGEICQHFKTPMIAPLSTNPKTTLNRTFVFRAAFMDDFQGKVMADFAVNEFTAKKAAVLYDPLDLYAKDLTAFFKTAFQKKIGDGASIVEETFSAKDTDFSAPLKKIIASDADILFIPQYDHQIAPIVQQARAMGWKKPILGGDGWDAPTLAEKCGQACVGAFFCTQFTPIGAQGKAKELVELYKNKYNEMPASYAAVNYDATRLLLTAIEHIDGLDENLLVTRKKIRDQIINIKDFEGASGKMSMNASGNPVKSALIIKINGKGEFESYRSILP